MANTKYPMTKKLVVHPLASEMLGSHLYEFSHIVMAEWALSNICRSGLWPKPWFFCFIIHFGINMMLWFGWFSCCRIFSKLYLSDRWHHVFLWNTLMFRGVQTRLIDQHVLWDRWNLRCSPQFFCISCTHAWFELQENLLGHPLLERLGTVLNVFDL